MANKYIVKYFESSNKSPVEKFILKELNSSAQAKTIKGIEILNKYGISAGFPHVKKITKYIYELRIRGSEEVRYLFTKKCGIIYLLHGFKKKKWKIDLKEIEIAKNRLKNI